MKQTFLRTIDSLKFNIRTLLYFEILYRLLGVLIIFPISRLLFALSIRLSGYTYISNPMIFEYLEKPTTIIIIMIMLLLLSFYIVIELVYLSLIFDCNYHRQKIGLKNFIVMGMKKVIDVIKKYHIILVIPAFLFFILVELLQIVGIASTMTLPQYPLEELHAVILFRIIIYSVGIFLVISFIETVFSFNLFSIDRLSIKQTLLTSQTMLKRKRLKMVVEFGLLNVCLNLIIYGLYLLIIGLIAGLIFITRGQQFILGFLLTLVHIIYIVIGFIATIFLIPINYALVSTWYFQSKEDNNLVINPPNIKNINKTFPVKWVKRTIASAIVIIFALNISGVISIIAQTKTPVEFFKYAEIIAHRGASNDAPENTIAAIDLAIEQGADAIEIDIRETADHVPILMHDSTLGRTTNDHLNQRVRHVNYEYIQALDAGSWFSNEFAGEKVPTLEQAIIASKGRTNLFIELKDSTITLNLKVLSLIEQYNMVNNVMIMSFSETQLRTIKNLNPNIETVLLVATVHGNINALVNNPYIDHFAIEANFLINNTSVLNAIQNSPKKIYVWTVNRDSMLKTVVEHDVDGIITDFPIRAREIAHSKNKSTMIQELIKELFVR